MFGKNQHLNTDLVYQLTEIGRVDAQVIGEVFMRNKLQDMGAASQEVSELILR